MSVSMLVLMSVSATGDIVVILFLFVCLFFTKYLGFFASSPSVPPTLKPNACPNGGFECTKHTKIKCVTASQKCNFKKDCEDGSDESADVCGSPCNFEKNMCGWRESSPNNFDWTRFHGCTSQSRTCADAVGSTSGK